METSLVNQVAYLKQTNARKNLYQGNVSQQHTNVQVPDSVETCLKTEINRMQSSLLLIPP